MDIQLHNNIYIKTDPHLSHAPVWNYAFVYFNIHAAIKIILHISSLRHILATPLWCVQLQAGNAPNAL